MRRDHWLLLLGTVSSAAWAQDQAAVPETQDDAEIVVTAPTPQGTVIGNIPPEIELGEEEIASYGVSSLADLVTELAPQTGSGRGRSDGGPVILLNGLRISGFNEIRLIPPEAIQKVQVLPEEAAIAYGYRPEQRVMNIILRPDFRSLTGEARTELATDGGRSESEASASLFRNGDIGRLSLDLEYDRDSPLLESERDIPARKPDERRFRTLLAASDELSINGTLSRAIFGNVSATLNGKFDLTDSRSLLGLPSDEDGVVLIDEEPLRGDVNGRKAHLGLALNGRIAPWQWSLTANYDHDRTRTLTDRGIAGAALLRDHAVSVSDTGSAELVMTGPLLTLPAGKLQATFKAGGDVTGFDSSASGASGERETSLSRREGDVQASVVVPLTSRREQVLPALGNVSANFNAGAKWVSGFGTIETLGYGLNWEPAEKLRFALSASREEGAPSLAQLGNPEVVTPNVRLFDFLTGQTVDVTRITGGNPALRADRRDSISLSAWAQPMKTPDLTINLSYTHARTRNPVMSFPTATPSLEAAFPERFVRDADGRLVSVDTRPVNFARSVQDEIRWGVFLSLPFGKPNPKAAARQGGAEGLGALMPRGPRMGGPGGGGRGMGGYGRSRMTPGMGRLLFSIEHKWRLEDRLLIRDGLPELDLLNGDVVSGSGGRPAHEITARMNLFKDGIGGWLSGSWQSATRVNGAGGDGSSDLRFSDLAKVNLRLFVELDQQQRLMTAMPWLKGARLSFGVDNLFNARQKVRNALGDVPLGYQPDYLDPMGRTVRIGFRKMF